MQNIISTTNSSPDATAASVVPKAGPMLGFGHMFKKEMRDWFSTRRWFLVSFITLSILVGFELLIYLTLQADPSASGSGGKSFDLLGLPVSLMGSLLILTAVIVAMGEIIEEKKSGTAAWIMSKPASRIGFVLSKWAASTISVVLLGVLIPGAISLGLAGVLTGQMPSLGNIELSLGLMAFYYAVFVSFTIFLGTFLPAQNAIAAAGIGSLMLLAIGGSVVPQSIAEWLPTNLNTLSAAALSTGSIFSFNPLISGAVILVGSVLGACAIFSRQEL